jgi:sugar O-acyltransferase (sialic acid O-acetyltransferase NeuD family)
MNDVILVGYSGHAFVIAELLLLSNYRIAGYCEPMRKELNPFELDYLGEESSAVARQKLKDTPFFAAFGDNKIRRSIYSSLINDGFASLNCVHPHSVVSTFASLGSGVSIMAGAIINPFARVGNGVIVNTNATIDHESQIGSFTHIAPGAVITGNVTIGQGCFIGANSVVRQGITIGNNVIIGAGSVVVKDVGDDITIKGVPAK